MTDPLRHALRLAAIALHERGILEYESKDAADRCAVVILEEYRGMRRAVLASKFDVEGGRSLPLGGKSRVTAIHSQGE
jgi:hypothetical protein